MGSRREVETNVIARDTTVLDVIAAAQAQISLSNLACRSDLPRGSIRRINCFQAAGMVPNGLYDLTESSLAKSVWIQCCFLNRHGKAKRTTAA